MTFDVNDVMTWKPDRRFDLWHDRAVFHFLVDTSDQDRYVRLAANGPGRPPDRAYRHGVAPGSRASDLWGCVESAWVG